MPLDGFLKGRRRPSGKIESSVTERRPVKNSLDAKLAEIQTSVGQPDDLIAQCIADGGNKTAAVVLYFETLVDTKLLGQQVIRSINQLVRECEPHWL